MVDWIFSYQLVFDESFLWMIVGALLLYLLSQSYALDGLAITALVFLGWLFVVALKNEAAAH
ncbi:MAG: hypothetical protein V1708_01805 [Candidatus Micrarchaeota archaeon]